MIDDDEKTARWLVSAIVLTGLGALAIIGAGLQAIEPHKPPARRDCEIVGYTASTLYTGTTTSGERVIVHAPPTTICKEIPR